MIMDKFIVIWKPAWYELDQSICVGEIDFFNIIRSADVIRFATAMEAGEEVKMRILSISNKQLGDIQKIEATGLSYKFFSDENHYIQVEAEENPGTIETGKRESGFLSVTDFYVEVELLP